MFQSGMREEHEAVVNVEDASVEALEAMIKYIYTGELPEVADLVVPRCAAKT